MFDYWQVSNLNNSVNVDLKRTYAIDVMMMLCMGTENEFTDMKMSQVPPIVGSISGCVKAVFSGLLKSSPISSTCHKLKLSIYTTKNSNDKLF